jgi:hypothetical protein
MKPAQLALLLVFTALYGCGGSKPTMVSSPNPPLWFASATNKAQIYYDYQNAPIADSLKKKSVEIALKNGAKETIDLSDVVQTIYYARKLKLKEQPLLADAISQLIQGLQAGKNSSEYNDYFQKLNSELPRLALSLALRADSITLAVHQQINRLDAQYRQALPTTVSYQTSEIVFFTTLYEKMRQLIALEQEILFLALSEYQIAAERLKAAGLSNEEARARREKFFKDIRSLIALRGAGIETLLNGFNQVIQQDRSKAWYLEAVNHYQTLKRLSEETLAKLKSEDLK